MLSIVIDRANEMQQQAFNIDYMSDFVGYIDRGEKTTATYLKNLRQFAAWLRFAEVQQPQRQDIINYRDFLAAEHEAIELDITAAAGWKYRTTSTGDRYTVICKPNTVAQYLRTVKQFFVWLSSNGLYPNVAANVHAPKIRHDEHKKEALTAADVLTVENDIKNRFSDFHAANKKDLAGKEQRYSEQGKRIYAMYLLAVNCGLRTIELSRANVKDIVVKNGQAWLYVWGKGHSEADQKKPLAPEVFNAINDYLKSRTDVTNGNRPLFVSTGNRSKGQRIAETTISKMLKGALISAGYNSDRLTAHSLRHTAGTNVQEITGNLYLTQQYMRHASPTTTEIYLHNETSKQEAGIAQQLYNFYHNIDGGDVRQELENRLASLSPEQIKQLTSIAAAMSK
jgi:integrase/recombinase XerC